MSMSALRHVRSRRALWLAAFVIVVAAGGALLVPALGSAAAQGKPSNSAEPEVLGIAVAGQTLTGTEGTWSNGPTHFAFEWRRCPSNGGAGDAGNCTLIAGASSITYALTAADVGSTIRFRVTATNADGSSAAASNPTDVVDAAGAPVPTTLPTVTGNPVSGQTLTASTGTWSGSGTITFALQWLRCNALGKACSLIAGATSATYELASADVVSTVRVRVVATDPVGSTRVGSATTDIVRPGPVTGCPAGTSPVPVTAVTPPARLVIDEQQTTPPIVGRGRGGQFVVRYHVSDTCGQPVQGALVSAFAVPFGQLSAIPELPTDAGGFVTFSFVTRAGYPLSPRQRRIQMFVRARKPGESLLIGISSRRLFSIPMTP